MLASAAEAVRRFDFSRPMATPSLVREVNDLGYTMEGMKSTIQRLQDISRAVAGEDKFSRLLPLVLRETLRAVRAGSGVLYLSDRDGLIPVASMRAGSEELVPQILPMPFSDVGPLLEKALRERVPVRGAVTPADIETAGLEDLLGDWRPFEGIAIPLVSRGQELVGAMLVLQEHPSDEAQMAFLQALSGIAATSLEARELIQSQKELFESFVKLIASAIDAKSPYTGGHCARLPELTKMLARAACTQGEGPYRDFRLDERDWEALHVASWLHDCGKITTPEYVVDKATKLETMHDRIHEVRMRFEVMKRDARIEALEARAGGEEEAVVGHRLSEALAALDDDYRFVARCNLGGESMSEADVDELRRIAGRTWLRTLDDRLGISQEELDRKSRAPAPGLPALEQALADKAEHRIARGPQERLPGQQAWGFRLEVPEQLFDRGELHNLAIPRGTLTPEERYKVNEHIIQTIVMLSQLPFPKHLRDVPEIAGGHHERMDGKGYPRGLRGEQMSPAARMMAIADIFEALTAIDRPYKRGKTLSESLRLMAGMRDNAHIDPDLFEIFLRSGVFREYAVRFMRPEQIDEVNIEVLLPRAA